MYAKAISTPAGIELFQTTIIPDECLTPSKRPDMNQIHAQQIPTRIPVRLLTNQLTATTGKI